MSLRIVLADDHRMFREALAGALAAVPGLEIVGEAATAPETVAQVECCSPDVLILDIALIKGNGIEVAREIRGRHPAVRIVALSGYADRLYVEEMLKAGAMAYVVKSAGTEELVRAIHAVQAGHTFLSPEVTSGMVGSFAPGQGEPGAPLSVLGAREREVLRLLAAGRRSAEIAAELGITPGTVDVHRRNIKRKLGLRTLADLTRYAIRTGLQAA